MAFGGNWVVMGGQRGKWTGITQASRDLIHLPEVLIGFAEQN